ncbi:MAG: GNAT family N-acetyltransferase [Limimaricola sp.]|uniref:GNAT family N-acetyltransferase n=1 Tax=Limimaricola sp. TaxID=2211665 RepID=UPI001D71DF9C|nr:GNAT family N-acetyltransferase [Limimaricola sp.]MBI1418821.1 GNAT family N-acetyltransferase [Limimaricola sp.]
MMLEIEPVRTKAQAAAVERLAWDFVDWLRARYPERKDQIDNYLAHQKFAENVSDVRVRYGPPQGECLLAVLDGMPVGIVMLTDAGNGICEMNRMFVSEAARGSGAGRALVSRLQDCAPEMGFRRMELGALPRHHEALSLYRKMGFVEDPGLDDHGGGDDAIKMAADL